MGNIDATEGVIVAIRPDRIIVNQYPGADRHSAYPRGRATTSSSMGNTNFVDGVRGDLKVGREIWATGLELGTFEVSRLCS